MGTHISRQSCVLIFRGAYVQGEYQEQPERGQLTYLYCPRFHFFLAIFLNTWTLQYEDNQNPITQYSSGISEKNRNDTYTAAKITKITFIELYTT